MIKSTLKSMLASSAGWTLTSPMRRRGLIVIMYHRINVGGEHFFGLDRSHFREQMLWLRKNCRIINPSEIEDSLVQPSRLRPPVLITFDDGFKDYHDHAYPILEELRIPALVFVATSFLDSGGMIWTDQLQFAVAITSLREIQLPWDSQQIFALRSGEERSRFVATAKKFLKAAPNVSRLRYLHELLDVLGKGKPATEPQRQMLTWDEVRAVMQYTTIGGHTHTHPILSRIPLPEAKEEIRTCYERIEQNTGIAPRYFAYPNGRAIDYNKEVSALVHDQGFKLAFSTIVGVNDSTTDRASLRRQPGDAGSLGDFARLLSTRESAD